jgi:hypothetical protein
MNRLTDSYFFESAPNRLRPYTSPIYIAHIVLVDSVKLAFSATISMVVVCWCTIRVTFHGFGAIRTDHSRFATNSPDIIVLEPIGFELTVKTTGGFLFGFYAFFHRFAGAGIFRQHLGIGCAGKFTLLHAGQGNSEF